VRIEKENLIIVKQKSEREDVYGKKELAWYQFCYDKLVIRHLGRDLR
jgi:hypothetical protein